jgi:hypothetical protein
MFFSKLYFMLRRSTPRAAPYAQDPLDPSVIHARLRLKVEEFCKAALEAFH